MTVNQSFTPAAGCFTDSAERRLYTVIPAYEPDEKLIQLVKQLRIHPLPENFSENGILIVDDGSSSASAPVFDRIRKEYDDCRILVHPVNRGKGAALKTAFAYLLDIAEPDDVVILMDADGQHKIEDAMRLALRCAEDRGSAGDPAVAGGTAVSGASAVPEAALYTGSRHFSGRIPLRSRLGNKITRKVVWLVSGIGMEDTQTGLRAFQAGLLKQLIRIPGDRYEYEMNMLMQLGRDRVPIIEVPIETIYEKGNPTSHFNPLKDSLKIYREIFRFWIRSTKGGRNVWQMTRFGVSSLASFLVDFCLYAALILAGVGTAAANVMARTVSASFNFTVNRELVFRNQKLKKKSSADRPAANQFGSDRLVADQSSVKHLSGKETIMSLDQLDDSLHDQSGDCQRNQSENSMHDQSEESLRDLAASALRYAGLALVVLAAGTLLLTILTEQAGIPQLPAKLIVEPIMFLFSFFVQKLYVFKNPDYSSTKEAKTCFVNINGSFFPHF